METCELGTQSRWRPESTSIRKNAGLFFLGSPTSFLWSGLRESSWTQPLHVAGPVDGCGAAELWGVRALEGSPAICPACRGRLFELRGASRTCGVTVAPKSDRSQREAEGSPSVRFWHLPAAERHARWTVYSICGPISPVLCLMVCRHLRLHCAG